MRSITRALALTLTLTVLTSSAPAFAAARAGEPRLRDRDTIARVIKRVVKRIFGVSTDESVTVPIPAPSQP